LTGWLAKAKAGGRTFESVTPGVPTEPKTEDGGESFTEAAPK
jgi:hypothetical protein